MQDTRTPLRLGQGGGPAGCASGLTGAERQAVEQGRLFSRLPAELQQAILGRAYVHRLKDGEQVLPENGLPEHMIGVASGELMGRCRSPENGQMIATHVLPPGVWLTVYSPLCGVRRREIEFVAIGPTCVLALGEADLRDLCNRWPEFVAAMLALAAMNLRWSYLVLRESQSFTLDQKLLRWIDCRVRFGHSERDDASLLLPCAVPQSALAAAAGVSRQSWNSAMARLEAAGVLERVRNGIRLPDLARLEAALKQQGLRETAQFLQSDQVLAPAPLPAGPMPLSSLRGDERAALENLRWFKSLCPVLREQLLPRMQLFRLPDKAMVAQAERQPPGWATVLHGHLRLTSTAAEQVHQQAPDGMPPRTLARTIIAQLPAGTTFFEHALIDGGNCGVDVACDGATTLLLLAPEDFRDALAAHPGFSLGVLKWTSFNLHQLTLLKLILTLPMPLRLHAWLDVLAHNRGRPDGAWTAIPMSLGQQEIAGWLSTTRQYVAKALNDLESQGTLLRTRDFLRLRPEALPLSRPGPLRIVEEVAEHR